MAKLTHPKVLETVPIGNLVYVVLEVPADSFTVSTSDLSLNILLSELGIAEIFGASMVLDSAGANGFGKTDFNNGSDGAKTMAFRPFLTSTLTTYPLSPHQSGKLITGNIANGDSRVLITSGSENILPGDSMQFVSSTDYNGTGDAVLMQRFSVPQQRAFMRSNATQTKSAVVFQIGDRIDQTNTLDIKSNVLNAVTLDGVSGILTLIGRRG